LSRRRDRIADWRGLLQRNRQEARTVLHALLVGPLRLTPIDTERRRGYEFAGLVALDRLIAGVMDLPLRTRVVVASPTGFEPVFWP
jgi:hypothetical protein